ncbi:FadR/GntR family transcriptional regulator [Cytophagaceae bacterium DM2B3-1]|uniref:FadR/GntR family transcriptional regulator n=1 Tax=Xanthocytophaga flava TaxID=3048013 RepID=A0ABT7CR41_9BACT|nr:FadR/GntR family transcriptional regulator [Xanthocytophaga flavus]MDJ1466872.1 FadR/GntR family transcriptional regulator [Xanthocytophaga flavus]MDJ1496214.1 FadR/GntR family transcriptional regulator [Xanthocytophaga flavus]
MLQRKSLAQEVADLIKQDIQAGVYSVNEKLPSEPELMKKFGVGRSSVREAVKYLEQSGYVNVVQGVGTHVISTTGHQSLVSTLQQADLTELLEVRQFLETKIVEKAALNRNEDQLERMHVVLQKRNQFAKESRPEETVKADVEFHTILAESCGNRLLYELYKVVSVHLAQFFTERYLETETFLRSQKLHEDLFVQIKAQNPVKALKIIKQIIGTV